MGPCLGKAARPSDGHVSYKNKTRKKNVGGDFNPCLAALILEGHFLK